MGIRLVHTDLGPDGVLQSEVEHRREIGDLGKLSLTGTPKLRVYLEPWGEAPTLPPSVREDPRTWTVLAPSGAVSVAGAKLRTLEDASILAEGAPAETDTYTIAATSKLEKIRALRLEALSHASLPHGGPGRAPENGNFVLSQLTVTAAPIRMGVSHNPGRQLTERRGVGG